MGADLITDFLDFKELSDASTVAIAPLPYATGIQIKVLTSAAAGLPQVISPSAADGLAPGFPACVAEIGQPFASKVVDLLNDTMTATELGRKARTEVQNRYTTEQWTTSLEGLLTRATERSQRLKAP